MDGEEQVVYSAGNSWIVCRSKTHTGRIYYFNTLTGEAAWNLSDAEIEKAKHRTKSLANQNNINIQECPEPEGPPMEQKNDTPPPNRQQSNPSPSRVYNKQIINNKITKQSYPYPFIIPPYNVVTNSMNSIMPLAVNSTPAYNPNVWAMVPNQQIYIGPSVSPLDNQGQSTTVNVAYNNPEPTFNVQHTASSLSGRFTNLRPTECNGRPRRGQYKRRSSFNQTRANNNTRQRNDFYPNNFKKNLGMNDLRQVLSARKQRRSSFHDEYNMNEGFKAERVAAYTETARLLEYESENEEGNFSHVEEPQKEKNVPNHADSDWLEENIQVKDGRSILDISKLKKIEPDMDSKSWYIVADKDVLLNHLHFLIILCNSDDDCLLMVAQQVMAELQESRDRSGWRTAARARRAVSFLLQQVDAGYAVIGDGTCEENDTRCDYLINCCSNLYEQNYHVILLSNNDEFNAYKNVTNIPIFNIKEIKQFLAKSVPKNQSDMQKLPQMCKTSESPKTDRLKPRPCETKLVSQTKAPMRIIVTNDLVNKTDDKTKTTKATQFNGDVATTGKWFGTVPEPNEHDHITFNKSILPEEYTETGVQTDIQIQVEPLVMEEGTFIFPEMSLSEVFEKTPEDEKESNKHITPSQSTKREIRLNRSVSAKTSAICEDTNVEKKQFKWRKKRHVSSTTNDAKLSSTPSSNIDDNSTDSLNTPKTNKVLTSCEQPLPQNKSEESISSETSSFRITRNVKNGTLIVEETSTSDIISNSTMSNVDSISEGNKLTNFNFKQTGSQKSTSRSQKSIMYEVTDQSMEDCLRTMNDEWVSRFIQIMEEVLPQVLRMDEQFLNGVVYKLHGGGPWNIQEAAECIKIKFSNNFHIVDAASKLTDIFMKISDQTGRITTNLKPSEFMEMYSFGVYLIKSLHSVLQDCEDLESAAQSLLRLLEDIQNPNFDSSHNETFGTHPHENVSTANDRNEQSPTTDDKPAEQTTPIKQLIKWPEGVRNSNSPLKATPNSSAKAKHSSPAKAKSNSPAKAKPNSPAKAKPNSPAKDKPNSPSKAKPISPAKATPNSPSKAKPNSPAKDKPNSPSKAKPISPAKATPNSPSKATPNSPAKALSSSPAIPYSLRSRNKSCTRDAVDGGNKKDNNGNGFIKNIGIKNSFFNSLDLVKKPGVVESPLTESKSPSKVVSNEHAVSAVASSSQDTLHSICDHKLDEIRQICPAFKKNIENSVEREPLDMDQLDYSAMNDDDENYVNGDYSDEEYYGNKHGQGNTKKDKHYLAKLRDTSDEDMPIIRADPNAFFNIDDAEFNCDSPLSMNNNLNSIFRTIIRRVKETIINVQAFCMETQKELGESQTHTIRRKFIVNEKAEKAQVDLDNLCRTLNSIFNRETYEPENNIQSLLKNAGINDFDLNDNLLKVYRDVIGICLEQVQILQKSVALIVTAIKRKPID